MYEVGEGHYWKFFRDIPDTQIQGFKVPLPMFGCPHTTIDPFPSANGVHSGEMVLDCASAQPISQQVFSVDQKICDMAIMTVDTELATKGDKPMKGTRVA